MRQKLKSLWLTETIHLIEAESGRFADQDINRQVRAEQISLTDRIVMRATMLSKQNGLYSSQKILIQSVKFSFVLLLLFSVFLGGSLALGAVNQNPINLYWALFSLLGVHLITLSIWLCSFFFFSNFGGSLLIHCWLWLAKKLSQKKTIQQLFPAFIELFGTRVRWLIGFVLNLFWTVILSSALLVLVVLFSTKYYSFEWQTTLLSSDTIIRLTHYLGYLPSLFGFDIPKDDIIKLSENALNTGEVRSSWAVWLLGVFIAYGLLVRVLCMIFCGVNWLVSCRYIKLNITHPDYQVLANQLQPLIVNIEDADRLGYSNHQWCSPVHPIEDGKGSFLVAVDVHESWHHPESVKFLGFLNTREQRNNILDYFQLTPAKKLLIAIDTDRAPDRGLLNFINQLINKSQQTRIWFINQGKQYHNWQSLSLQLAEPDWLSEDI
ncbi:DUF2868 domain-containing protein [Gilliamella sp. Pra-s65]|uniref:DUF2868 domain-containing protein n=1 Tax=unclassified Gilliamella TaxID=2685620 RepID=UPI00132286D5|nr:MULTISPECIES: DUF2868 domain-containing protein [unclassified Gilliamella]MWN32493.1 DUF2868 domain-containing protein [Gilliamella sp. Pra-s60]MWN90566.1 DUF2868 domain-containing protein [Gilliamella sp. Pra-s65]MWP29945.1 DUF2868 domain-containing protein [Gilliamella sp. Pra-s54]MWP73581.1 DUF2868 domain-containing protein [Gilliamella sp. Pra-s52]